VIFSQWYWSPATTLAGFLRLSIIREIGSILEAIVFLKIKEGHRLVDKVVPYPGLPSLDEILLNIDTKGKYSQSLSGPDPSKTTK